MAWYTITHLCGHNERHQLTGNSRTREWRAGKLAEELCSDCYVAERDAVNARIAAANEAAGLPPLTGSEKQIAWAETIRAAIIEQADAWLEEAIKAEPESLQAEAVVMAAEVKRLIRAETKASWWIDNRARRIDDLIQPLVKQAMDAYDRGLIAGTPAAAEEYLVEEVMAEATVRPENEVTEIVTEIRSSGNKIELCLPENRDDFRALVKALGYQWTGDCWTRVIADRAGPLTARVAEIGHRLLCAGFPISIQDGDLRARAIAGDYQPEQKRWITRFHDGEHVGQLFITWPRDEDLYAAAKALPGARYVKPGIALSPKAYDAILDFAEAHGFAISAAAQTALDAARQAHDQALIARPGPAPAPATAPGAMPPVSGEIDPELIDDLGA